MQVANEGGHDLLESGIGGALKLGQYRGRDVSLIFDDHGMSSSAPFYRPSSPSAECFSCSDERMISRPRHGDL
jgi:hypothetical protein